ncbi:MAG TPA: right-handed parallel beta-helix repeat-containing protein, partial [Terriglobia bacterium]|nr:right-handed parallel beta-helix repeat-containing protein [Terriglobia bacterium]
MAVLAARSVYTFPSPGEVLIRPTDNIQSLVSQHPPGTSFVITPGLYRLQTVEPKAGDFFTGEPGAILSGAQVLSTFTRQGQSWVAATEVKSLRSYRGKCDASHPACMYPEDLFFDSKPLHRVTSLSQVGPGSWYLDYGTEKVYVGSDPA